MLRGKVQVVTHVLWRSEASYQSVVWLIFSGWHKKLLKRSGTKRFTAPQTLLDSIPFKIFIHFLFGNIVSNKAGIIRTSLRVAHKLQAI